MSTRDERLAALTARERAEKAHHRSLLDTIKRRVDRAVFGELDYTIHGYPCHNWRDRVYAWWKGYPVKDDSGRWISSPRRRSI